MIEVTGIELNAVRLEVQGKTLRAGSKLKLERLVVGPWQPLGLSYDLDDGTQVSKVITRGGKTFDLDEAAP